MNIFILDTDISRCARYHCDRHVVKMILESVQMLCTVASKHGHAAPYRPTHANHPCVRWLDQSYDNHLWLQELTAALNREYRYRYRKQHDHASMQALAAIRHLRYESNGLTPFAQVMPEQYQVPGNAVTAYRNFYCAEKLGFATWTHRRMPAWVRQATHGSRHP